MIFYLVEFNNLSKFKNDTNSGKSNLRRMDSYNLFKEQENIIDEFRFRDIHNKEKLMRYLSSNNKYEVVKIDDFDISMRIHIPFEYLKNEYNKNISSYGLILYNKYPLMSPNNRNFSEKVISLRMFSLF